jgi:hypothetical protein
LSLLLSTHTSSMSLHLLYQCPYYLPCSFLQHASALTRQLGDTLYKSLENFTASVEASHKKEMMRSAAMQECQVGCHYAAVCVMWIGNCKA